MLRSSVVVYTALLAVFILKRKLFNYHYVSILCIIIGLVFVGLSTSLKGSKGAEHSGA
jgi:drug/metabolite transporter (DMT)-like permease